jgi:anti-anti-sigma factor
VLISSDSSPSHQVEHRARPPRLQVQELVDDTRHTLILTGELDRTSSVDFEAVVLPICENCTTWLVLDLSQLGFMDLYGLRMVLFAKELCEWHGCDFGLVPGPRSVQRAFELTNRLDVGAAPIQAARRCSVGPLQSS